MIFRKGDKVNWMGIIGYVIEAELFDGEYYPLVVMFDQGMASFTLDGKYHMAHKKPSLKLVKRYR